MISHHITTYIITGISTSKLCTGWTWLVRSAEAQNERGSWILSGLLCVFNAFQPAPQTWNSTISTARHLRRIEPVAWIDELGVGLYHLQGGQSWARLINIYQPWLCGTLWYCVDVYILLVHVNTKGPKGSNLDVIKIGEEQNFVASRIGCVILSCSCPFSLCILLLQVRDIVGALCLSHVWLMLNSCCFNPPMRCLPCSVCSVLQTHSKMTFDSSHRKPGFSKITIIILQILTSACLWGAIGCGNEHQKTLAPKCKAARCPQRSCSSSHRFAREETSLTQSRDCRKFVGKGRTWNKFAGTAVCVWKCVFFKIIVGTDVAPVASQNVLKLCGFVHAEHAIDARQGAFKTLRKYAQVRYNGSLVCSCWSTRRFAEGSLEVKLPTIWTDEEAEAGRGREEKESEERKSEETDSVERRSRCAKR